MRDTGCRRMDARALQGRAWVFPTIEAARVAYQVALHRGDVLCAQHDYTLVVDMVGSQAVLTFLWGPHVDQRLMAIADTVALLTGGNPCEKTREEELVQLVRLWLQECDEPDQATGGG